MPTPPKLTSLVILAAVVTGCAAGRSVSRPHRPGPAETAVVATNRTPDSAGRSGHLTAPAKDRGEWKPVVFATATDSTNGGRRAGQVEAIAPPGSEPSPAGEPLYVESIDLATALAAIDASHPAVGIARWRTEEAFAQLAAARTLWLPTLQAGANYHRLDGNLQASDGTILDVNRSGLQAGLGAGAVGAGQTVRPGLVAEFHVADALFQPRIVERRAWARGHAATAVLHDQLLAAGLAHQQLLWAHQRLALLEDHSDRIGKLAELTADFAAAGEGLQSDADRLATERQLAEADVRLGEEQVTTSSARLVEALSAPPGMLFICAEPVAMPIELLPVDSSLNWLVSTGLSNRPELKEAQCLVAEAVARLRRERTAPLVPSVLLGMNYGGFGGGLGDTVAQFHDRAEFNALAVWQIRNLGFGESAVRGERGAAIQQAMFDRVRVMDRVAREIVEAQGQAVARSARVEATKSAIETAANSYDRNLARIRQGQGLPIEALQSAQALFTARQAYLQAVVDYNEAQLRLYRALGWPVRL